MTWKDKISCEKRLWFRSHTPSILASNLALKSQWEDQILLYYLQWKSTLALPELACWGAILGAEKGRGCAQNTATAELMRMRTRTWEGHCIGTHWHSVIHWENKSLFWVIQVCPELPVSPRENWSFQKVMKKTTESHKPRCLIPKISKCYVIFTKPLFFLAANNYTRKAELKA